jgi:predicted nucleic acid-binding protein
VTLPSRRSIGTSTVEAGVRRYRRVRGAELVRVDESVEEQAWSILESHADKSWSYVDATSFALMERERITEAFAFDHHFAQCGLTLVPYG